jgi:hypothetical protein
MARNEQDREDLLREATALVERVELELTKTGENLVAGFRRDGCVSFFFGRSPVWQFNTNSELRRAFLDGRLLKGEKQRLVALHRERSDSEVVLVREDLSADQEDKVLALADEMLHQLLTELSAGRFTIIGQVPVGAEIISRLCSWLRRRPSPLEIAAVPNAK